MPGELNSQACVSHSRFHFSSSIKDYRSGMLIVYFVIV
ncbi:hypothetical protein HMPREF1144_0274 [Klebsiella sp. OBRC7]|nr:hypothetical protein HMPREF1144_0274 [Klebsiella sp. OBRC7]